MTPEAAARVLPAPQRGAGCVLHMPGVRRHEGGDDDSGLALDRHASQGARLRHSRRTRLRLAA